MLGGSTNEKPRKRPGQSDDRKGGLATFRPQLEQLSLVTGVLEGRPLSGTTYVFINFETRFLLDFLRVHETKLDHRKVDARPFSSSELILAFLITGHSKGEEARKLEDLRRVSRTWAIEGGSWGFYIARPKRYNLMD